MKNTNTTVQVNVKLDDFYVTFRQSSDNHEWTEMFTTDICPSHMDADRRPIHFMSFDNSEIDSIINALTAYRDTVTVLT